jgi:glycosyltransferase involved in cell wall biosynthesis
MDAPLAAIITTVYNTGQYLEDCLESALSQRTNFPFVLIVSEDCGKDNSREIIKCYKKKFPLTSSVQGTKGKGFVPFIVDCSPSKNMGLVPNSYWCLSQALSLGVKYVSFLDSDDIITDVYKLQDQVNFLEKNPEYQMVYSDNIYISADIGYSQAVTLAKQTPYKHSGARLTAAYETHYSPEFEDSGITLKSLLTSNNPCVAGAACFRTDNLSFFPMAIGDTKNFVTQDLPVWLELLKYGKIAKEKKVTFAYRDLTESWSRSADIEKIERFQRGSMDVRNSFIDKLSALANGADSIKLDSGVSLSVKDMQILKQDSEKFYYGKMLRAYAKNAPEKYFKFVCEALKKYPVLLFANDLWRSAGIRVKKIIS